MSCVDGVGENRFMPIVSIIVPVYNVEQYINRCIDSLIGQSFTNIEIILIDDGSNDASGIICDTYAHSDRRIKLKHVKNAGVSNARNVAMKMANGDYITFVDADDWLEVDFIENSINIIRKYNADILLGNHYLDFMNGKSECALNVQQEYIMNNIETVEKLFIMRGTKERIPWSVWGKLYRKEILDMFDVNYSMGEDAIWLWNVLKKAKTIIYNPFSGYHYFQRNTSVMHRQTVKHILDDKRMYQYFYQDRYWLHNDKMASYFEDRYFAAKVTTVIRLFLNGGGGCIFKTNLKDFWDNIFRCFASEWKLHSLKGMLKIIVALGCVVLPEKFYTVMSSSRGLHEDNRIC